MKKIRNDQLQKLKTEYQQTGYVIIRRFFSKADLSNLRKWAAEVIMWPETRGKWLKYYELLENQQSVLSRIENFVRYHDGFSQLVDNEELNALLSTLIGEPVLFFKEKLNVKVPGAKGYTPHQDAPAFFSIEYDAITLLTAIDDFTIENGCLYFAEKGTPYREAMLKQNEHNRALSKDIVKDISWKPMECRAGDVIIFSAYAPHFSKENKSAFERKALFLTFGKKRHSQNKTVEYYDEKRKVFPQDCEKIPGFDYTKAASIYSFSSPVTINLKSNRKKTPDDK